MDPYFERSSSESGNRLTPAEQDAQASMFFNEMEARTVEAIAARVMPSEPDAPGAREAGVVFYIDRAVAGYFRSLQTLYRAGIQELNDLSGSRFRAAFAELSEVQQDGILAELDGRKREPNPSGDTLQDSDSLLMRFFSVVRDHTIQGMFCDPLYGGNRNGIGWKMIGFPGAQWGYSADQLRPGFDATTIPVQTLNDLQRRFAGDQHA